MARPGKMGWCRRLMLAGLAALAWNVPDAHAQIGLFRLRPDCGGPCTSCPSDVPPSITQPPKEMLPEPAPGQVTTAALDDTSVSLRSNVGYIYSAIPRNTVQVRYDAAYDNNRPDRAEFFYAKCGCFRVGGADPGAGGPPLSERRVDYQDLTTYLEFAPWSRFSAFIEAPYRWLNPQDNANVSGFGDMKAGFKAAFISNAQQVMTLQFRTYIPTGRADQGLGTNHVSVEPSLLYFQRLTPRLTFESQLGDWVGLGGSDFNGNVLFYGAGLGYNILDGQNLWITPVTELVGWTVVRGQESLANDGAVSAVGDTIVNGKMGVRIGLNRPGLLGNSSLYMGYGRALTGEVWYKDIFRIEWRTVF